MADVNQVIDNTLDSLNKARTSRPEAGSSRKGDNPVLFLVGNSTMRTGTLGNGNNGQWGWGYYAGDYFDSNRITVENHALGGTSSRTFYNRLWPDVIKGVRPGDWVIIELGHNDNGPYDSGRARASIPGIGKDTLRGIYASFHSRCKSQRCSSDPFFAYSPQCLGRQRQHHHHTCQQDFWIVGKASSRRTACSFY